MSYIRGIHINNHIPHTHKLYIHLFWLDIHMYNYNERKFTTRERESKQHEFQIDVGAPPLDNNTGVQFDIVGLV